MPNVKTATTKGRNVKFVFANAVVSAEIGELHKRTTINSVTRCLQYYSYNKTIVDLSFGGYKIIFTL